MYFFIINHTLKPFVEPDTSYIILMWELKLKEHLLQDAWFATKENHTLHEGLVKAVIQR